MIPSSRPSLHYRKLVVTIQWLQRGSDRKHTCTKVIMTSKISISITRRCWYHTFKDILHTFSVNTKRKGVNDVAVHVIIFEREVPPKSTTGGLVYHNDFQQAIHVCSLDTFVTYRCEQKTLQHIYQLNKNIINCRSGFRRK